MPLSEQLEHEIAKRFPESDRETIRDLLTKCQADNVRIAVLRLARGRVEKVAKLVEDAQRDYRDVLSWASQPIRRYIAGILRKGPTWSSSDENGRTHLNGKLLMEWKKTGVLFVGGWFMDLGDARGFYVFTVDSIEEAKALTNADPAIQAGKLLFEFHPWQTPELRIAKSEEL